MPDSPPDPDTGGGAAPTPDRRASTATPRWVKVSAIVALVLVLLLAVVLVTGLGGHQPGGPANHI